MVYVCVCERDSITRIVYSDLVAYFRYKMSNPGYKSISSPL